VLLPEAGFDSFRILQCLESVETIPGAKNLSRTGLKPGAPYDSQGQNY